AAWTLLLIAGVFLYRGMRFLTGTPINHWPRGNKPADDAPFVKRLEDAHANCLENLPVFAVIVLVAAALGRLADIQALAPWVLYARIGQSLAHLSGTGPVNVFVRASFWSAQLALFGWMLVKLLA
ncbi:MAG TPA: MAPEG family protein, partial [Burkholderiaceae bacterium]|nr:MAPEG family protein [Burkholderiaceae bacterium]